jgi:hypothetical protein
MAAMIAASAAVMALRKIITVIITEQEPSKGLFSAEA